MSREVELKPCPFCGHAASIERMGTSRVSMIYRCDDCGCQLETGEEWLDENCAWNRRTPPPSREEERTIEQRAWAIVDEHIPKWWNDYARRYPHSKVTEPERRRLIAHACVVAALAKADAIMGEG